MREIWKRKWRWYILGIAPIANAMAIYVYYSWGIIPCLLVELLIGVVLGLLFLEELSSAWSNITSKNAIWIAVFIPVSVVVTRVTFLLMSEFGITKPSEILMPITDYDVMNILFIGPITEELSFRFFVFKVIKKSWIALVVSSVLFGLMHVIIEVIETQNIVNFLPGLGYAAMGAVFGLSYKKTRNIWVPIIVHSMYNLITLLSL